MGWQPGQDGDRSAAPDPLRDPRLSVFAQDGEWDGRSPSAAAAAVLKDLSGPEWRCPGASRDEMLGMLRQAQALESWASAVKAGILRSLIRDDDEPLSGGGYHGDLPEGWTKPQSAGWKITQPRPGWHQWQTPSGRMYTWSPKHYPT